MIATTAARSHDHKALNRMCDELVDELSDVLDAFHGEDSLKEIFWSILSYDQQRLALPTNDLRSDVARAVSSLQLFAVHDKIGVVRADCASDLNHYQIESLCARLESRFPTLVLLLHSDSENEWQCVYPDRTLKHHLRFLSLPGSETELRATAKSLAALTAVDWNTDGALQRLDVTNRMDVFFPGGMPKQRWEFDPSLENTKYAESFMRQKAAPVADLYHDISSFPLLTARQERGEDYSEPVDFGDGMNAYRWRLVLHNIRLVINIALKFPTNVLDLEDLVQEGIMGLITAARKFEPDRGNRFSTYAWYWIRQAIFRAMQNNQNLIRWPVHRLDELIPANKDEVTITLTPGERAVRSLEDDDLQCDALVDLTESDPLELDELCDAVHSTIERRLDDRQQRILQMRYGLDSPLEMTLEEVGQVEGVTRERIRQIQEKAIDRFKRALPRWVQKEFEEVDEPEQEE